MAIVKSLKARYVQDKSQGMILVDQPLKIWKKCSLL